MHKYFLFPIFIILCISCSQWRVSELKSKTLLSIPSGSDIKQIYLNFNDSGVLDITFSINASKDRFFIADNKSKRLQIFDMDGSLVGCIGQKKVDNLPLSAAFSFGIIGSSSSDSENKIYIQNRIDIPPTAKISDQSDVEIAPSYILVFDHTGKLQYSLGQKGPADIPFNFIEKIFIDSSDRLFVITKNYETWGIYRFKSRIRDFFTTLGKENFKESEGGSEYSGVIENIVPFRDGNHFLISVAYYHNTRFKYRKIYNYNLAENAVGKIILKLPDPRNELYTILDDKYVLLWDTEENSLRFAIWDLDGNIVNNLRLRLNSVPSYLNQIFTDENGRFFSYSIKKNSLSIMEWK
jgi:hypothetical protein